jgi:predicted secreted protein
MKKVLILAGLLAATTAAHANELNYNVISISAKAEREVPNDLMRVQLMVEHQANKAKDVSQKVNADMAWALAQLKQGLKYETQQYNTYPVYEKTKIKAWRASQQLMVQSENFEQLSNIILVLQNKLQVKNMSFEPTKKTRKKVEDELVAEALDAYKSRASLVQKNMQAKSYKVVNMQVNTQDNYSPMYRSQPRMKMAMSVAEAAPAVKGGNSTLSVNVNGQIQLQ